MMIITDKNSVIFKMIGFLLLYKPLEKHSLLKRIFFDIYGGIVRQRKH